MRNPLTLRSRAAGRLALLVALLLLIVGAKFRLIDRYGSDLPYWDQWDAEGDYLIRPYLDGRLKAAEFIAPHNEHRIAFTRLLVLGLYDLGGHQWDGRVQVEVNAVLHAAIALLLLALAWRATGPPGAVVFAGLAALLFGNGMSWENTLVGFQSQFYFVLLFTALHVGGVLLAPPRSWRWWLAPLAGVAAIFSMASGPLSAMAVFAALVLRAIRDRRLTRDDLIMLGLNAVLIVAGMLLQVTVPGHAVLKAHGIVQWFIVLLHQLAWPIGFVWACPLGIVPPLLLLVAYFRRRVDGPVALTLIGASAWAALEAAATAYARGAQNYGYSSRYFDGLAIGVLINVIALLYLLAARHRNARRLPLARFGLVVFVGAILWGVARQAVEAQRDVLDTLPAVNRARIAAVRGYVLHHDPSFFHDAPWDQLPYPNPQRLAELLDTPEIRASLPPSVNPPVPLAPRTGGAPGFSRIAPAGTPRVPGQASAWFSTPGSASRFESRPFSVRRTRVTLFVTGRGEVRAVVRLCNANGRVYRPLGRVATPAHWKRLNFAVPPGRYRLVVDAAGSGWMGFTAPVVNSWLSVLGAKLIGIGPGLLVLGALAALLALLWLRPAPPPAPRPARRDLRAALSAGLLALGPLVSWLAAVAPGTLPNVLRPQPAAATAADAPEPGVPGFGLRSPDRPAADFSGAVFVVSGPASAWFGTYAGGDGFTGRVVSTPFTLAGGMLHVPIIGYPTSPGNALDLDVLDARGRTVRRIPYRGPNPREYPGLWDIPIGAFSGRQGRLVLVDGTTHPGGWLGVGAPVMRTRPGAAWLRGVPRNYGWFAVVVLACVSLLFVPGLALRTFWSRDYPRGAAYLALPGLGLLTTGGLLAWIGGSDAIAWLAPSWLLAHAALAGWLARRWWRDGMPLGRGETAALGVYACVAVAALAYGVLPLTVAQEFDARSAEQGRMIASPPDSSIPYRTAVYFWHQKSGRNDRVVYFGDDWSVASRGPVAPLMVTAGFAAFGVQPHDPPSDSLDAWPAAADGYDVARIIGILTNALVVLAGASLARRLATPAAARLALAWLAVAPLVAINTDFLWPKLLAAFFVLLALEALVDDQPAWWSGGAVALAYLSHPVGGLFAIPLATFAMHRAWRQAEGGTSRRMRSAFAAGLRLTGATVACLVPWLAYKAWVGFADPFPHYPLGDGRGFAAAASVTSWLQCRWDNLWLTLTPAGFYFSPFMHAWLDGPLSEPLRWAIGYAKSLPGEVGLLAFCLAAITTLRRARTPVLSLTRLHLLAGALALMLVFWGFSNDGLGRNCLEPLGALLIVYASAAAPGWRAWRWILPVTALETLSVRVLGVVFNPGFNAAALNTEAIVLATIAAAATVAPAIWFLVTSRGEPAGRPRTQINHPSASPGVGQQR